MAEEGGVGRLERLARGQARRSEGRPRLRIGRAIGAQAVGRAGQEQVGTSVGQHACLNEVALAEQRRSVLPGHRVGVLLVHIQAHGVGLGLGAV